MNDRRRTGWAARLRRRLFYRGALLTVALGYTALAVAVWSTTAPIPPLWVGLFSGAALTSLATVWRPRVVWLRQASGIFGVVAPLVAGLGGLTIAQTVVSKVLVGGPWLLLALLSFISWPEILPPHIDAGRLAARLDDVDR